jgi:hypothetical protein
VPSQLAGPSLHTGPIGAIDSDSAVMPCSSPTMLPPTGPAHPMVTRTWDSTWRPKEYIDGIVQYNSSRRVSL